MHQLSAALVAVSLVLASTASAEDARITCTGTVSAINGPGMVGTAFAGVSVGESVTIVFDVEIARQLPFGDYLYLLNTPTTSISVGAVTDGVPYSVFNVFFSGINSTGGGFFIDLESVEIDAAPGYFLISADQGFTPGAGGSDGNLCLGGAIGRFKGEGQVTQTDFGGEIALPIDLTALPSPTSNFTRGLSVMFL